MILTLETDFELWSMWVDSEVRKEQRKNNLTSDSPELEVIKKDILLTHIEEKIALHLITSFKDNRRTFNTLRDAVQQKHKQLSRPVDLHVALRSIRINVPSDSFMAAREIKRLATYVNGDRAFLVQHFLDAISDYDFKLLIQQRIVSSELPAEIDDLANFLSQMPPKSSNLKTDDNEPMDISCVVKASVGDVWKNRKCFNCGKFGHGAKFCRSPKRYCETCKKFGHTTQSCFSKN